MIKQNWFPLISGKYSSKKGGPDDSTNLNGAQNVTAASIDANKKMEELAPLLHQARISSTSPADRDGETSANTSGHSNRSSSHKSSYRKRVKTKLSRKTA